MRADLVIVLVSTWTVRRDKGSPVPTTGLEHEPDRIECATIMVSTIQGSCLCAAEIKRTGDTASIKKFEWFPGDGEAIGRFANLLSIPSDETIN